MELLSAIGIVMLVMLAVSLLRARRNKIGESRQGSMRYDERQETALGKAARRALAVVIVLLLVLAPMMGGPLPVSPSFLVVGVACVGIAAYATSGIRADAYFGISGMSNSVLVLWIVLGVVQLAGALGMQLKSGLAWGEMVFLPTGVTFIIVAAFALAWRHHGLGEEDEQ